MSVQLAHGIRFAVEGCGHGTLHAIYASVVESCKQKGWPGVDLLIIGGDFQAVRNAHDLNCVSMPAKYRSMCDFHEYYAGQRMAPYLTIFVGGNHEASNYLSELYYGGWVAPNIYYMGAANVVRLGPLRLAGMSGIWKGFDYRKPHFERLPYNESDMRSIYHVREMDVRKLLQLRTQVDIGVSHDWPQGVEWQGNWRKLFKMKKHFEDDARSGRLGSVAGRQVLHHLRPKYWLSAHLHCKFAAIVEHGGKDASQALLPAPSGLSGSAVPLKSDDEIERNGAEAVDGTEAAKNSDEIDLDLDEEPTIAQTNAPTANTDEIDLYLDVGAGPSVRELDSASANDNAVAYNEDNSLADARAALPASFSRPKPPDPIEHPPGITNTKTKFLALDKCLPNRNFLQLMSIPSDSDLNTDRPLKLQYDREWLAITRAFALSEQPVFGDPQAHVPRAKTQAEYAALTDKQLTWVNEHLDDASLVIPENFSVTAPIYDGGDFQNPQYQAVREFPNPQTTSYCHLLQMPNPLEIDEEELVRRAQAGPAPEPDNGGFGRGRARGGFERGRGRGNRGNRGRGGGRGRGRGR